MKWLWALLFLVAPFAVCLEERQAGNATLAAAATGRCFEFVYQWQCETSTYSRDAAELTLGCGSQWLPYAENSVAVCTRGGENNEYCFHLYEDANVANAINNIGPLCASAVNSSTCSPNCSSLLQTAVDQMKCCFNTIFNERLTTLILGHNVNVSLNACGIRPQPACNQSFPLVQPRNPDNCTFDQYWSRLSNFYCRTDLAQAQINALLADAFCLPMARHTVNACGVGPNGRYCLDLYGTSFNPTVPFRTLSINPDLRNVTVQCANYSRFRSEGCPPSCKSALETAVQKIGCCVSNFNDSINQVLHPLFSGDVMIACGVASPGVCSSNLTLVVGGGASQTLFTVYALLGICILIFFSS